MFLLVISLFSCGIDEPEIDNNYPTKIYSLSSESLSKSLEEYLLLNNYGVCTQLNSYGFCEYGAMICPNRQFLKTEINDENEMIRIAKEFIMKNNKFTGVTNIDELQIFRSKGISGCIKCDGSENDFKITKWRLDFKNQIYKGYEILNTELVVFLDNDGVFIIGGNWYSDIVIPKEDRYNLETVKENLSGRKIHFSCWENFELTITQNMIKQESRKVIYPMKMEDRLELRVAWEIYILGSQQNPMWVIYIDSTTGEVLLEYQLIDC